MRTKTTESINKLFSATWNVPEAAKYCGLTNKEMRIAFAAYCVNNPATYQTQPSQLEIKF